MSSTTKKQMAKEKEKLEKSKKNLEIQKKMNWIQIKRKEEELKKKQKQLERKEIELKEKENNNNKIYKVLLKEKKRLTKDSEQNCRQSAKRKLRSSSAGESTDIKRHCSEDIKQKTIEDLLESELTCSVCSEYFIQTVNLNCSHTFCLSCIEEWKKSKTGTHVCPICRQKIVNQNSEPILDNLIDQFVGQMKPQLKEHRMKLTEERKKRLEKMANTINNSRNEATSVRMSAQPVGYVRNVIIAMTAHRNDPATASIYRQ